MLKVLRDFIVQKKCVELDRRAREAAALMAENFMVCLIAMHWL